MRMIVILLLAGIVLWTASCAVARRAIPIVAAFAAFWLTAEQGPAVALTSTVATGAVAAIMLDLLARSRRLTLAVMGLECIAGATFVSTVAFTLLTWNGAPHVQALATAAACAAIAGTLALRYRTNL